MGIIEEKLEVAWCEGSSLRERYVDIIKNSISEKKKLGEKMSSYDPSEVEYGWYSWWFRSGFFSPEYIEKRRGVCKPFVVPIPPPNITGSLHLGHAMATSIQDAMVRWKRMQGYSALYIPGSDHAGISCQVVVEKQIYSLTKKTPHDIGREEFLKEIFAWKSIYGERIFDQLIRMGGSFDWSRKKFTLDKDLSEAVSKSFIQLFDKGLIYRDTKLINWCSKLQTSISDIEVDHLEIPKPTSILVFSKQRPEGFYYKFGYLYEVAYKIIPERYEEMFAKKEGIDSVIDELLKAEEEITVMTTRPETILGDTAVAVHPDDGRYAMLVGRHIYHPFRKCAIKIIADRDVDKEFGSGAVKITPAHDPKDYEMGKRHNLSFINIYNSHNCIDLDIDNEFQGMDRFSARDRILEILNDLGLYKGRKDYSMRLPVCGRSGDIVEPRMSEQWWMDCKDMAKRAKDVVLEKKIKILPAENVKIWCHWLDNIRDWCLSRQLWWGHRVPAYYVSVKEKSGFWVSAENEGDAINKARIRLEKEDVILSVEQDPDVLDTWYSSGLWPFSILGWPKDTLDFEKYYPCDLLETGKDILFFWVARMVMLGMELTGKIPFHTVFLHSIIRDAHGRKMSKSLGNVIDPIDVIEGASLEELEKKLIRKSDDPKEIEKSRVGIRKNFPKGIPRCGVDALRFAMCNYVGQSSDVNLDILRIEGYRKFCNKIWNLVKFSLIMFEKQRDKGGFKPILFKHVLERTFSKYEAGQNMFCCWILIELNKMVIRVNRNLENYNMMEATNAIHSFTIGHLCDIFVEVLKYEFNFGEDSDTFICVLYYVVQNMLKVLHPFMPFITEELYQRLPKIETDDFSQEESICVCAYPIEIISITDFQYYGDIISRFCFLKDIVDHIRSGMENMLGSKMSKNQNAKKSLFIYLDNMSHKEFIHRNRGIFFSLIKNLVVLDIRMMDDTKHIEVCFTKKEVREMFGMVSIELSVYNE